MKKEYYASDNEVFFKAFPKNCRRAREDLAKSSVDVIVTSPPYKDADGFSLEMISEFGGVAKEVLKKDGLLFLNMGQLSESPERPFASLMEIMKNGFKLRQTIVWAKSIVVEHQLVNTDGSLSSDPRRIQRGHVQPINSDYLLNYCHEYVFVIEHESGDRGRKLDRLSIGIGFADLGNLERDTRGKNGDNRCGGDIWWIPYPTTGNTKSKFHMHEFPLELPIRCIKLSGIEKESLIWDPFMGCGNVALAAKSLKMNFVGNDLDRSDCSLALRRWKTGEILEDTDE